MATSALPAGQNPPSFVLALRFWCAASGNEPVRDWLRELPAEARKVIGEDLKTVQLGWPLGMPLVRKLEADLWEVRIHIPDGIARVLFTTASGAMVLLHGFVKKSQKTPSNELDTARRRLRQLKEHP